MEEGADITLLKRADLLYNAKQYALAESTVREYISLDNLDDEDAWQLLAMILTEKNDDSGAYEAINRAIQIDPENAMSYLRKANIAIHFDDNDVAIDHFEESIRLDPDYNPSYGGLSIQYLNTNQNEKARMNALQGLSFNPEDANALNVMSYLSRKSGRLIQATRYTEQALESDPTAYNNLYNASNLNLAVFKFRRAHQLALSGLRLDPENEKMLIQARLCLLALFIPYGIVVSIIRTLFGYPKLMKLIGVAGVISFYFLLNRNMRSESGMKSFVLGVVIVFLYLPIMKSAAMLIFYMSPRRNLIEQRLVLRSFLICITTLNAISFIVFLHPTNAQLMAVVVAHSMNIGCQILLLKPLVSAQWIKYAQLLCTAFTIIGCYVMLYSAFWSMFLLVTNVLLMLVSVTYINTQEHD
jgi:tetratricopeptide (TPR) repeat protein